MGFSFYRWGTNLVLFLLFFFRLLKIHIAQSGSESDQNDHDEDKQIGAIAYYLLEHSSNYFIASNLAGNFESVKLV